MPGDIEPRRLEDDARERRRGGGVQTHLPYQEDLTQEFKSSHGAWWTSPSHPGPLGWTSNPAAKLGLMDRYLLKYTKACLDLILITTLDRALCPTRQLGN